jgi:hypothetical protein
MNGEEGGDNRDVVVVVRFMELSVEEGVRGGVRGRICRLWSSGLGEGEKDVEEGREEVRVVDCKMVFSLSHRGLALIIGGGRRFIWRGRNAPPCWSWGCLWW